jgi:prepilin-type N-terminal cleavage/methylation domain-containing protein
MKKAFTMIELVFVIVVIGILAAVIIPRTDTNPAQEAAIDILSKIRYTQHLAIVNDTYNATDLIWFRNLWAIQFNTSNSQYSIVNNGVFAADPSNRDANLSNIDLASRYGVTVTQSGCGTLTNNHFTISFDYLGRPLVGNLAGATAPYAGTNFGLLQSNCNVTLRSGDQNATISIVPETGYARIL